ncbi:Hypothetical protein RAK1035_0055 [Roseovarius sp. AK1035]|nr:Hypothetical protein RAK1035_0055 [Roseovarius sp. AK1035]
MAYGGCDGLHGASLPMLGASDPDSRVTASGFLSGVADMPRGAQKL